MIIKNALREIKRNCECEHEMELVTGTGTDKTLEEDVCTAGNFIDK